MARAVKVWELHNSSGHGTGSFKVTAFWFQGRKEGSVPRAKQGEAGPHWLGAGRQVGDPGGEGQAGSTLAAKLAEPRRLSVRRAEPVGGGAAGAQQPEAKGDLLLHLKKDPRSS